MDVIFIKKNIGFPENVICKNLDAPMPIIVYTSVSNPDSDGDPHHLAGSRIRIVVQENLKSTIFTFWNIIQNNEEKK